MTVLIHCCYIVSCERLYYDISHTCMCNDTVQINALCVNKVDVYSMTAYMLDNRKCVDIVDY